MKTKHNYLELASAANGPHFPKIYDNIGSRSYLL
uniref:Uncharacterized protein n=1 Tax=Rhizophora mucronata TaxID=61149 RepID=A0A2P2PG10_RHIMU